MLVYPPYQYVTTRQDESGNSGFFETLQNYFVNFGNSQTQSDENSQIMDPVEPDKQQQAMSDATKTASKTEVFQEKVNPTPSESKQKLYYSYITPASTVPLNNDRRLFYLAEQPQVYGTFSGSAINPVFNLQPVPVVLSRSNVAQSEDPQPIKQVITENVQKPQIPAGIVTVDQVQSKVQVKSGISDESDSVVVEAAPENRIAPAVQSVVSVEDNRALLKPVNLPVSTEATVEGNSVVIARSNAVPFTVSGQPVSSSDVVPKVVNNVEGIFQPTDAQSFLPAEQPVPLPSSIPDVPLNVFDESASSIFQSIVQGSGNVAENVKSVDNVQPVDSVKPVSASV